VVIRLATQEDWPGIKRLMRFAVAELRERFGVPDQTDMLTAVVAFGMEHNEAVYVAEATNGEVVGYVAWVGGVPGVAPGVVLGAGTYVLPSQRGHGISSDLRDAATKHCRDLGYSVVRGDAHVDNVAGIKSCERQGFKVAAYVMEKAL